jgi:hypothetical protein
VRFHESLISGNKNRTDEEAFADETVD